MVQQRLWVLGLLVFLLGCSPEATHDRPIARARLTGQSELVGHFEEAERATGVPAALLATIAYVQTRLEPPPSSSDGHAPREHGIMAIGTGGLTTLERAAELSGSDPHEVEHDARANVRAAALLLEDLQRAAGEPAESDADFRPAVSAYGGEALADRVLRLLADGWKSSDAFGRSVEVAGHGLHDGLGKTQLALGFPGSIWSPAHSGNYTNASRGAAQINYVVIHTTQGSYAGAISWFKNPASNVSSHYVVRSSDGQITQMVDDADIAHHDGCFNSQSIGIEHEGYVQDPGKWYTEAMYAASAKLTAWLCDSYGIPKDRQHIMGHGETPDCSDHTDPGGGWNWDKYMALVESGGSTAQNCSTGQADACGGFGCWCVNGECNGGYCPGTGCTAQDVANCAAFGCQCVDGQCGGGFCPGSGCTAKEMKDCAAFGCNCVDHQCSGGFCDGSGCTAKEITDCGNFGCGCVDHQCSGAFCPGSGCTAKQTTDCDAKGKTCKDAKCVDAASSGGAGGSGSGSGSGGSANGGSGNGGGSASGPSAAGSSGAGSTSGVSGSPSAGGGAGSWAGSSASGGSGGSAVKSPQAAAEDVDGGCACRATPSPTGPGAPGWPLWLAGLFVLLRRLRTPRALVLLPIALALGCASESPEPIADAERCEEPVGVQAHALSSIDCNESTDTGYTKGNPFPITVVTVDGKKVETATANAYYVMAQAAAAAGVNLQVVSGFRTMTEQQYLYGCYINCNCNNCNLAAKPGHSNHQSGHALDLNTSAAGVYGWLEANAANFGFKRTVPSEPWHWEWWGGGPGGGPCGKTAQNCSTGQADACGGFGCWCVNGECNGGYCPGNGCTAQDVANCAAFGCQCVDGQCAGGFCPGTGCTAKETTDCAAFGCNCVDHQCSGGFCDGNGCTAKEITDCGNFGCGCVDHQCSGAFCPGSGCTAKQTTACEAKGQSCKDGKCVAAPGAGGSGGGSGSGGDGGSSGSSAGTSGTAGSPTSSGGTAGAGASGGGAGGWSSPGGSGGTSGSSAGTTSIEEPGAEDVDGSCACSTPGGRSPGAGWLSAIGAALLTLRGFHSRRKRRRTPSPRSV